MTELTLLRRGSELADPAAQLQLLARCDDVPTFEGALESSVSLPLTASRLDILQINVGKLCNQTCRHCHVDAGPDRRESMSREIAADCLAALGKGGFSTLDITGGAPEMNPNFRWLVQQARCIGVRVIDRCNLTILGVPGFRDLPEFLAEHQVEVVASLPCYLESNTDRQRGKGVHARSIEALRRLNDVGYGREGSKLQLNLVYNPVGPELPGSQTELETAYRRELEARYGVQFTNLFTITNLPISRFLEDLWSQGLVETYLRMLVEAFNPASIDGLMCRTMISVDWRGHIYDCDFNQMLDLAPPGFGAGHIRDFDGEALKNRAIATGRHCFGCTAGAGSSCSGAIT